MHARSALFDLYGDHLRARGGAAPVAALVRLLAELDVAGPAVRTAISRMVRQGWLHPTSTARGPGYALTARATARLDEAASRIYRLQPAAPWDRRWSVVLVEHTASRAARDRLARGLEYLGYRQLHTGTWIAPRPSPELEPLVAAEGLRARSFLASYGGDDVALVDELWNPAALAEAYLAWLAAAEELAGTAGQAPSDATAFATRSRLVHEWRKFLFHDPGLPRELLPPDWPGDKAAAYFDGETARLLPGATAFVDACLERREQ